MVKFIEYKKEKYPVRLSYRALKSLKGSDLTKVAQGEFDDAIFENLLWAGLQSGHTAEEKELTLKKENIEDILDECFFEFVKIIPEFFPKAQEKGNAVPNQDLLLKKEETPPIEMEKA